MPTSAWDGRQWVTDRLADSTVSTVVDVGPGEGTYSVLGRHLIWAAQWIGVEIFEPYVERFNLGTMYDHIVIADIRDYQPIISEVLEHMEREDAVKVLAWHLERAAEVYVSVPIVESIQGPCFGNDHEAHLHQWTFEEMSSLLPGADAFMGMEVGRWYWRREDAA
jgi:hypothetical protein